MASLAQLSEQLQQLLPNCDSTTEGPCLETATSGRGYAVYDKPGEPVCESDILLPGFNLLPRWLLAAVYLLFLLYLFAGVAIASDMFMDGIMQITATTRKVKRKNAAGETVIVEVPVWNWVVANISLMALGTSAPEIMLALVEAVLGLGKPAGEMGPSCIAGSAAYNFLVISAVCTCAIPAGQFKRISQMRVYITTALWSMWAYVWMLIVYVYWTPDEVTLAEALITLGFFFVLLLNAWIIDTQPWKKRHGGKVLPEGATSGSGADLETPGAIVTLAGADADDDTAEPPPHPKTLAHYRHILAARQRNMHRNRPSSARHRPSVTGGEAEGGEGWPASGELAAVVVRDPTKQVVMFRSHAYSFLESAGVAKIAVVRLPPEGGSLTKPLRVSYCTEDGDAVAGLDYEAREGELLFAAGEHYKTIEVPIIDDDLCEPDVRFFVRITAAQEPGSAADDDGVLIVQPRVAVTIVDDDDAGVLGFELPELEVAVNENRTFAEVTVVRRRGADGRVQVEYASEDLTAVAGSDYKEASGTLVFEGGEKSRTIRVDLLPGFVPDSHKALRLVLRNPDGGAELGRRSACKLTLVQRTVTLLSKPGDFAKEGLELGPIGSSARVMSGRPAGGLSGRQGSGRSRGSGGGEGEEEFELWSAWRDQIKSIFSPEEPDEEGEEIGWGGLIMQYINITWKLFLFTMVPPARWKGGYPCFLTALAAVIGIVYLVNEAGSLFGCMVGLKEVVVGISIVALGTSLPDTLASRIAAVQDPDADAAIGNITGSNCVNVFLGLGLPWTICSIYYTARGEKYVTPGGDLEFAIMMYAILGGCGIVVLAVARYFGGELGGSKLRQYSIAGVLISLWFLYLILSGLRAYGNI
ncbi:hypothetical protein HYH03_007840 [Edaphochlamys debaryana]|uniref:Calx-beta domain-containing protein n=1 Tax=Edaphochlamys debaryana TaxID=47281 RepID=A0A836BZY5_9CHLO|nr:hypothetical protein HYH03_007840 [Edaphochlamys debaryana]|eukprot:KAG2493903.1 hypothetical protein HYH03_007840 [Edaphochlamys debaryana]